MGCIIAEAPWQVKLPAPAFAEVPALRKVSGGRAFGARSGQWDVSSMLELEISYF
jgi:hypothetical protein